MLDLFNRPDEGLNSKDARIGIQLEDKVIFSHCFRLGGIYHTGLILDRFYNTESKIKELVSFGYIHSLGPKLKDESNSGIDLMLINYANFNLLKERMTLPAGIDPPGIGEVFRHETYTTEAYYCDYLGGDYNYLYDTASNTWYVCGVDKCNRYCFFEYKLKDLLTSGKSLREYLIDSGNEDGNDYKGSIAASRSELNISVTKFLTGELAKRGIKNYEIDVKQHKQGKNLYGLYKVAEDKTKRRVCIAQSPYAYQLIMYMACYYKGNLQPLSTLRDNSNSFKHLLQVEVLK